MQTQLRFIAHTAKQIVMQPLKIWLLIGLLIFLGFATLAGYTYITYTKDVSTPEFLMNRNNTGLVLMDRKGDTFYRSEEVKDFKPVELASMPKHLKDATIAIEDKDFYKHGGISVFAIARSVYLNVIRRSANAFGGSTITQQLVKNALLTQEKSYKRKFQEAILALEVERRYSKDQILEMYLNSIYYGAGAYGVSEAAEIYFGKDVGKLTLSESALLAALPQSPSRYTPFGGDIDALLARRDLVAEKMLETGAISTEEQSAISKTEYSFAKPKGDEVSGDAPHFAVWLRDYLFAKYGEDQVKRLGLRVTSTIDLALQRKAQDILARRVKALAKQKVTNGGIVTMDPETGEILALVGSVDWANETFGKFNIAFAKRQPGSSFKPIVYTRALEEGFKSTDILHDKQTDFGGGYKPKNYDGKFRGDVTLRRALANSLNVPAVELLQKVGVNDVIKLANDMGITTLTTADSNRYGLSLVLGGGEVELFELTRAYGVLANSGMLTPTHPILSIEDKFGNTVYSYNTATKEEKVTMPENSDSFFGLFGTSENPYKNAHIEGSGSKRAADELSAYITTHILKDNRARADTFGSGSALFLAGRPAAAKTGTTDDYRDSWTVGYTPDIVTGVWIGNNDNSPMERIAGSIGAAPIWNEVMAAAHTGRAVRDFPRPPRIVELRICPATGYTAACGDCDGAYEEVYVKGNEPAACKDPTTPTPTPQEEPTETPEPAEEPTQTPAPPEEPTETPSPTDTQAIPTLEPTISAPSATPLVVPSV